MNEYNPNRVSSPGASLQDWLKMHGMKLEEFSTSSDLHLSTTKGILRGDIAITDILAVKLAKGTGVSAEFWLARENSYRASLHRE